MIERGKISQANHLFHKKNRFFSFSARSFSTPAPKLQAKKNDPLYIAEKEKKVKNYLINGNAGDIMPGTGVYNPLIVKSIRTTQSGEMSS